MSKKCSECSFENEDKAKFCRGCGAALSAAAPQVVNTSGDQKPCPSCQSLNKPGAKFCLSCGYKFVDIGGAGSPPVTQTQPRILPTPAPTIVAPPVDAPTAPSPKPPPQPVPVLAPAIPTLSVVVPATPPTPQPLQQQATTANVISSAIESSKTKVSPRPVEKEVFVAPLSTPPDRLRPAPKPLPELIARKTEAGIAENAPPSKIKTQIVLGTAVVVVAVLAGGGYWYLNRANTLVETTAVKPATPSSAASPVPVLPITPPADPAKEPAKSEPATQAPQSTVEAPMAAPNPAPSAAAPASQLPVNTTPIVAPNQDAAPIPTKAPVKPREVRPKLAEPVAKPQPPASKTDSKKSAEDLRKQIEDELKGIVRKN